jgi:hypothetical protein
MQSPSLQPFRQFAVGAKKYTEDKFQARANAPKGAIYPREI